MNMPYAESPRHLGQQGFSLVEMLITLAVIGLMVAMSITYFGGGHRQAILDARDQRNAQEVVNVCLGAIASGAPVVEEGDMRATIHNLMEGKAGTAGPFSGQMFRLSPLSETEVAGALRYLGWSQNQPVYLPTTAAAD